jgi:drug/metabolite transporter (DMT)-like permease
MDVGLLSVGTGSGFSHALYAAGSKYLLKRRMAHPFLFMLYVNAGQALVTPLIWLFVQPAVLPAAGLWPMLAAAGTCVVAYFFLYLSLATGDVSSVMPMMGSKVIFTGLLAHRMLGERHSGTIYAAVLLVAAAVAALGYSPSQGRAGRFAWKPAVLMLACCLVFACTDVYIKRSLAYIDAFSFMVHYNALVALGSLLTIPYLRRKGVSLRVTAGSAAMTLATAACLVTSTMMFVVSFRMADGVVVPNILMASRGVFIVLFSALASHRGSTALDVQSKWVFLLRLGAAALIVFAMALAMR